MERLRLISINRTRLIIFFVRTITREGEQRIYWGKDLPLALEVAGAKVGDSITARRTGSKPVTVEKPDGSGISRPRSSFCRNMRTVFANSCVERAMQFKYLFE